MTCGIRNEAILYFSMLLLDRILFDSPFAYIELPQKIPPVTLNVYQRHNGKVLAEYPLRSASVFTELMEKIPAVILKVSFKTLGGISKRYRATEYLWVLHLRIILEETF